MSISILSCNWRRSETTLMTCLLKRVRMRKAGEAEVITGKEYWEGVVDNDLEGRGLGKSSALEMCCGGWKDRGVGLIEGRGYIAIIQQGTENQGNGATATA